MKNKIKLLLTALLLTLVWGFSFSSYAFDLSSWVFLSSISTNEFSFDNYDIYDLYCLKSSLSSNIVVLNNADIWLYSKSAFSSSLVYNLYKSSSNLTLNNYVVCIPYPWNDLDYIIKTNYKTCLDCEISWLWVYWYNFVSDCSSIQSSLNQCQSDLNSCQSDWSHCDTLYWQCIENFSGCTADKTSLENYNQSLTDQLNECLSNSESWSWEELTWNCVTNSLFWLDNDNMLSLPITNNLFLPNWFQWYLNSWNVLGISDIEKQEIIYEFDQESKENTINSLWIIMLFLVFAWFIFVLLKFLKKIFFKF